MPLISITRCDTFMSEPVPGSPCEKILKVQYDANSNPEDRQVPEPWRGSIDAPLLFVSSNPSLDADDNSPLVTDSDAYIHSYFDKGFPACFPKTMLKTGMPRRQYVRFWASVRARASELWGIPARQLRPGLDFAITELVHCKSRDEIGVYQALPFCMEKFWHSVIAAHKAEVVVLLGAHTRSIFGAHQGQLVVISGSTNSVAALSLPMSPMIRLQAGGRPRWVITLPHPNARPAKKPETTEGDLRVNGTKPASSSVRQSTPVPKANSVAAYYDASTISPLTNALGKRRLP